MDQTATYAPSIVAAPDGALYVDWIDIGALRAGCDFFETATTCTTPVPIYMASSPDGGVSVSAATRVAQFDYGCPGPNLPATGKSYCDALHSDTAPAEFPIAAGRSPGSVYVSWWTGDPEGPARVLFADSSDGGKTWSPGRPVEVPRGRSTDQQHRPQLAVAQNGRIDIAYYDVGPDGSTQNVYVTSLMNGASGFSVSQPRSLTPRRVQRWGQWAAMACISALVAG